MSDPRHNFPNSLRARYLEPSFIGEGAMGQVFCARDKALGSIVAIKVLARGAETIFLLAEKENMTELWGISIRLLV